MGRYLPGDNSLNEVLTQVINDRFPMFQGVSFYVVFDTKKRIKKGKIVLASVELTNDKLKFFTADDVAPEGYDYILIVDQVAWQSAKDDDRARLISHELRHVYIDEKGRCKIMDHDIEDFLAEIKLNQDKPDWAHKLADLTLMIYDQQVDAAA